MKEEEKRREFEMERLCDAEVEKMWARKIQQWKVEKLARQKLLEEVMESRRRQLQEKCEHSWLEKYFDQFQVDKFNNRRSNLMINVSSLRISYFKIE